MMNLAIFAIMASGILTHHDPRAPRRLPLGSSVCVNPPLNLTKLEIDAPKAARDLADFIRADGFVSEALGVLESCDATVYTEIVSKTDLEFRIVLSDEQIPRLCSSVHAKTIPDAFYAEARLIHDAQDKGMPIYPGAIE